MEKYSIVPQFVDDSPGALLRRLEDEPPAVLPTDAPPAVGSTVPLVGDAGTDSTTTTSTTTAAAKRGIALWIIIVSSVGGALLVFFLVLLICMIYRHHRRKVRHQKLEDKIFEHEKDRADKMLVQLKNANRAHPAGYQNFYYPQQQFPPPPCVHAYQGPSVCTMCYPAQPALVNVAPVQPVHVSYVQPQYALPQYAQPHYAAANVLRPRRASSFDCYGSEEESYRSPVMRRAESASELPSSPPPNAPPGFRVVPMVVER